LLLSNFLGYYAASPSIYITAGTNIKQLTNASNDIPMNNISPICAIAATLLNINPPKATTMIRPAVAITDPVRWIATATASELL